MVTVNHFINGAFFGIEEATSDIYDPSSGKKIGEVLNGSSSDLNLATQAAHEAFSGWSKTGLAYRANLLLACRQALLEQKDYFVGICTLEAGKTCADSSAEFDKAMEGIAYAASVSSWFRTPSTQNISAGIDVADVRFPIGVIAAVSPFNFPVLIPVIQAAMAIATGNTVVVKPSEKVPTAFTNIAAVMQEAGLPPGVLNVVNGGRSLVEAMMEHPDIAGLSFVGSSVVAKQLKMKGVENEKRVQAFGSGKNHMVVLPDADLDMAADAAVSAAYGASGQRCMAISVLVAVGDIGDELSAKIIERIPKINIGATSDANVQLGPVISEESHRRICALVKEAAKRGADVSVDGTMYDSGGWFIGATLIDHVRPGMTIYDQEVFGPVLCIVRSPCFEDAMSIIAGHPLGNGASIFTSNGGAARKYAEEVQVGMVGINVPIPVPPWSHSFGGWKTSAYSDSKLTGPESLNFYSRVKAITTRWPDPKQSKVDLGFVRHS